MAPISRVQASFFLFTTATWSDRRQHRLLSRKKQCAENSLVNVPHRRTTISFVQKTLALTDYASSMARAFLL